MNDKYQRLWILFKSKVANKAMDSEKYTVEKSVFHELLAEMAILEADVMLEE